jgi:hypothetical protein
MKLQKLVDVGAFTLGGDVILYDSSVHHQVKVADWKGGEDCELTADGLRLEEDGLFATKAPPRKGRKTLADLDLGDDDAQ